MTGSSQGGVGSTRSRSVTRRVTMLAIAALAGVGLAALVPVDDAEAKDYPGAAQVRAAKAAVRNQASTVAQLDAAVAQLEEAVRAAEVALYQAQEAYTEKQAENIDAQRQLFAANARADEAERALEDARGDLAVVAMAAYREGGSMKSFEAIMTADGFEAVITRTEAMGRASDDAAVVIDEVRAADLVAQTMREYSAAAADKAIEAERAAEAAYQAAVQADIDTRLAYAEAEATRLEAVARLADLRRVSAQLEGERQAGLSRSRAERDEIAAQIRAQIIQNQATGGTSSGGAVAAVGGTSVGSAAQGEGAVLFALAQIGDPYVYGANGPNAWDCSALTGAAWGSQGVYLPRSSKGQYNYVGKVPYSDLRLGDLIFWGTNGSSSAVYHVTMYIGNNIIVEAPSSGKLVKTRDYRNWNANDRMPWAGRP